MAIKVSQKGWVVIPAELRRKYHLEPGTEVVIVDYGGVLTIIPAMEDPIRQAAGILRGGPSLTQALLQERREELLREERKISKSR